MAAIEAKSAVGKWQSATTRTKKPSPRRLRSRTYKRNAYRRVLHFPETRGKLVEDVEFSTSSDYHNISINFQDKTSLNLSIETGFTLEPDYSDWKNRQPARPQTLAHHAFPGLRHALAHLGFGSSGR